MKSFLENLFPKKRKTYGNIKFKFTVPVNKIPYNELDIIRKAILSSSPMPVKEGNRGLLGRLGSAMGGGSEEVKYLPPNNSLIWNLLPHEESNADDNLFLKSGGLGALFRGSKQDNIRTEELPVAFTWMGNSLIQPATSQGMCGSCWAFAACGMFSDVIAIETDGKLKPDLSPTYLLSCRQQLGCGGGYPSSALEDLVHFGVVYSDCVDYGWCKRNSVCDGDATNHFNNPTDYLNSKIPACGDCQFPSYVVEGETVKPLAEKDLEKCSVEQQKMISTHTKCLQKGGKINRYFGKNPHSLYARTDNNGDIEGNELEEVIYDVQEHLITKGPVIGSYLILSNFMGEGRGLYEETDGVYIDNFQYKNPAGNPVPKDNNDSFNPTPFAINGGHAIVIVGYGTKEISAINPDTNKPYGVVGFWDIRNSWGTEWGNKGFFKMAMYPTSKFSQFDVGINLGKDSAGESVWLGGFSLIELGRIETVSVMDNKIIYETDDHDNEDHPTPNRTITESPKVTKWHTEGNFGKIPKSGRKRDNRLLVILIVFVIILLLIYFYKKGYFKK